MAADKAGVIAEYREAYAGFLAAVSGLSEEQLTRPFMDHWGVREIAAHIAGWHDQLTTGLQRMAQGLRPTPEGANWSEIQAWNDRFAMQASSGTAAAFLRTLDEQSRRFIAALEAVPDDRFGEGKTVNRLAADAGYEHLREHTADIREALAEGKL